MTKHIRKIFLREHILWPKELDNELCRAQGYCFSSEDGWEIQLMGNEVRVSCDNLKGLGHSYVYNFPWDVVAWISDKFPGKLECQCIEARAKLRSMMNTGAWSASAECGICGRVHAGREAL